MTAKFYDALYSRDGGPPRAYECLQPSDSGSKAPAYKPGEAPRCGHVLRTARGMELHLATAHDIRAQITLEELIAKEAGHGQG